jgi:hypothetical protein
MVLTGMTQVGQQSPVVHGIIIAAVRGEQQHVDLLVTAATHSELCSGSCSRMAAAAGTASSGQPQPDLISSSLHENHKQTNKHKRFTIVLTL